MPRAARYSARWNPATGGYTLADGPSTTELAAGDALEWAAWLAERRSLAFRGRRGSLSLLREEREGGGYWYAYRRRGERTRKRYAGRDADVSIARLEALAAELTNSDDETPIIDTAPSSAFVRVRPRPKPNLPAGLIARERLLALLDARQPLVLVCAPAGFGKTTLVRQWLDHFGSPESQPQNLQSPISNLQSAWVALDGGDNDPIRFWRAVIAACEPLLDDGGAAALACLSLPAQPSFEPSPLDQAVLHFLNALPHASGRGVLVLDDYHLIASPRIHATLAYLLDNLPPALSVCVIARHAPPLPLARLRARGLLSELLAHDLRFTSAETAAFLEQIGPTLAPAALERLDTQLEGWPAGLRLLALALRGHTAPAALSAALEAFGGSQRSVAEFFVAEVLDAQPPNVQEFLLRTSVLARLSAPLCAAVLAADDRPQTAGRSNADRRPPTADSGTTNSIESSGQRSAVGGREQSEQGGQRSAVVLEELERANLFIERDGVGGEWLRYHTLFAEAMQAEARRRLGAAELRRLLSVASRWYAGQGMLPEAIEAALRAEEPARAAELIERVVTERDFTLGGVHIQTASEFHTLRRWLEQIPDEALARRPTLLVSYATALLFVYLVDQVPTPPAVAAQIVALLERAEAVFGGAGDTNGLGEVYAFRSLIERQRGALAEAARLGNIALAHLPPDDLGWRSLALGAVGMGALSAARFAEAEAAFEEAHRLCVHIGNRWWARANHALLSYLRWERGELRQSAARFQHMLEEARADGDSDDVAHAQACLAQIAYEHNDLDAAQLAAAEARDLGEHLANDEIWVNAGLVLAHVEFAQGRRAAALQRLSVLLARLQAHPTPRATNLAREVQRAQVALQIADGNLVPAARWAQARENDPTDSPALVRERELRLVARLQIAQNNAAAAVVLLAPMLEEARAAGRHRCALEIGLLLALAYEVAGRRADALALLRTALEEAAAEGYVRLVLEAGRGIPALLAALAPELEPPLAGYVAALLRACGERAPDTLSQQEGRVLRLLAAGRSPAEIADELVVSVNTVRTQLQSVYRKLDVHNRVAAIMVAKERGLLA